MISVIIPVYNVEPYLRKCLDSVIGQTYRDLEILIVDDSSTDGSGKICDEYRNDERVRVFHTENRGLSATRNLGLDNATGDWISLIGLGLNKMKSPDTASQRKRYLRDMIHTDMYEKAIRSFSLNELPIYWKLFFLFVKCGFVNGIYLSLRIMNRMI